MASRMINTESIAVMPWTAVTTAGLGAELGAELVLADVDVVLTAGVAGVPPVDAQHPATAPAPLVAAAAVDDALEDAVFCVRLVPTHV